jgi:uncharacterized protein YndB with AHSA1/START domain
MGSQRVERIIEAPPEAVFRLYVDPQRVSEWQTGTRGLIDVSGPLDEPGTTYTVDAPGPDLHIEVTRVEAPGLTERSAHSRWYEWQGRARFDPTPEGWTRFTFDIEVTGTGVLGRLMAGLFRLIGPRFLASEFDGLKRTAESDQEAAAG